MTKKSGPTDLALMLSRPDPLFNFKWVVETMPDVAPALPPEYVESVDIPFNNVKEGDTWYGGSGYTGYAGPHSISSLSIVFYEDRNARVLKWLIAWKNLIKDFNTGYYGLPTVYKKDITVLMMDGANTPVFRSKMHIYPTDTGNLSLNYTDAGRVTMTQSFYVDDNVITMV